MTRRKIKLERIPDDAARKVTFRKRSLGLVKKVSELATLCAVKTLLIIYSPNERQPIVWPSIPAAENMITKYNSFKESERNRKMVTQESYLKERISKTQDDVEKLEKKNRQSEFSYLMHKFKSNGYDSNSLETEEKERLIWLLEWKKVEIGKRVEYFRQLPPYMSLGQEPPRLMPPFSGGEFMVNGGGSTIWDQGFLNVLKSGGDFGGGSGLSAPPPPENGGDYFSSLGIGHLQGGEDPFGIGLVQPDSNPFNVGSIQSNLNLFGIEPVQPDPNPFGIGSSDVGFEGFSEGLERELAELLNSESNLGELQWPPDISP